ncbi:MAG: outer membrane beta-barrel protein [Capnocytophaga sp.]|nr:outer membrane beta-barrel protein [Capnocytophaga sp.]
MKKILFILTLVFATATYAQTEKGSFFVGSDFGLSFSSGKTVTRSDGNKVGDVKTSTFKINPNANYFIIDNLAVGLGLEYTNAKTKSSGTTTTSNYFAIAPNAHYFFPLGGDVVPFVGAKVGFGSLSEGDSDTLKYRGLVFGGKAGVAYFLNEGFALTGFLDYDHKSLKQKQNESIKQNIGVFSVGVGVALFF